MLSFIIRFYFCCEDTIPTELQFNVPEFKIKREDNTDIHNKVLNLTPEDRKKLGINKSTLWYIQKHIKEGKRIKVYGKVMGKLSD